MWQCLLLLSCMNMVFNASLNSRLLLTSTKWSYCSHLPHHPQVLMLLIQYESSNSSNYCCCFLKSFIEVIIDILKVSHVMYTSWWVWTHAYTRKALPHHGWIRVPSTDSWSLMLILLEKVKATSGQVQNAWAKCWWWVSLINITSVSSNTLLKLRTKRAFQPCDGKQLVSSCPFIWMLNDLLLERRF